MTADLLGDLLEAVGAVLNHRQGLGEIFGMRPLFIIVAVLVAVGVAGWYGLLWIPTDSSYVLEAEFSTVPTDDEALVAWVRAQPGVYLAHVNRKRVRDKWQIEVIFGITRNGWGQPPLPTLDKAAVDIGYRGPVEPFHDSPW